MIRIITILFLFLFLSTWAGAQHGMLLAKPAAAGGTTYLLDTYTGAAAAYAVNKLKSDADSCMVIRRSSDNATQLIGFSGDDIDEATINSHCAGTDCFVVRWCDQTGQGNDITQSSTSIQPRIVASGVLNKVNGFAAIDFSFGGLDLSLAGFSLTSGAAIFSVIKPNTNPATQDGRVIQFSQDASNHVAISFRGGGYNTRWVKGGATTEGNGYDLTSTAQSLISAFYAYSTPSSTFFFNGTERSDSNLGRTISGLTNYVNNASTPSLFNSQLVIFYNSDQSANRTGIESNINTYYSIY